MPVPPVHVAPFNSLPSLIKSTFDSAVAQDQISIYQAQSLSRHTGTGAFSHVVLICPELDEKPGAPPTTPDLTSKPDEDPFEGPEFPEGQSIADIGDHIVLTNTNAMRDEHFMMTSKGFRPQASDPREKDLAISYQVLEAYQSAGRELICFFNGGPHAGASQPHFHIQFVPFVEGLPPGAELLARTVCEERPGEIHLLPTPWVQYAAHIPAQPSPSTLHYLFKSLLDTFQSSLQNLPASLIPSTPEKRDSYNLLLTTTHLHLIPRSGVGARVPHTKTKQQKKTEDVEELMTLNGMAYAGIWFVGCEAERDDLVTFGCGQALLEAGYRRDSHWTTPAEEL